MGTKLLEYYGKAKEMGGTKATMRMAMLTSVSSPKAADAEDSAENIAKFEQALKELEKEFN